MTILWGNRGRILGQRGVTSDCRPVNYNTTTFVVGHSCNCVKQMKARMSFDPKPLLLPIFWKLVPARKFMKTEQF